MEKLKSDLPKPTCTVLAAVILSTNDAMMRLPNLYVLVLFHFNCVIYFSAFRLDVSATLNKLFIVCHEKYMYVYVYYDFHHYLFILHTCSNSLHANK